MTIPRPSSSSSTRQEWFQEEARKDAPRLDAFCDAFPQGDAEAIERQFNAYLRKTISIRDTAVKTAKKENFYHGILLGLLAHREDWVVASNVESGDGYSDKYLPNLLVRNGKPIYIGRIRA